MSEPRRVIAELAIGTDLHGEDHTKAAIRAVDEALRRSTLTFFSALGIDHRDMRVEAVVGAQKPEAIDCEAVAARLPRGIGSARAVHGGLDVETGRGRLVTVSVAVIATLAVEPGRWRLAQDR